MTPAKARVVFTTHMQAARQRKLTAYETKQLNTARQVLRATRKPAMNPKTYKEMQDMRIHTGDTVYHKKEKTKGLVTGKHGWRIWVRWEDGEYSSVLERDVRKVMAGPKGTLPNAPKHQRTTTYYQVGFDDAYMGMPDTPAAIPPKFVREYQQGYSEGLKALQKKLRKQRMKTKTGRAYEARIAKYKNNPGNGVLIYGEVQTIYAKKSQNHICDDECKKHGHRYFHDFKSKPKMYGLPDGTLLIKP